MTARTPASTSASKTPWRFFLLVFVLSVPFWLIGPILEQFLGDGIPLNLPMSALMFAAPIIAAVILVYREDGSGGVKQLLKRVVDFRRIKRKIWYLPIFCLMPLIFLLAYGMMAVSGASLPDDPQLPLAMVPAFATLFFVASLCEEVGWSGYALDRLQDRRSALHAAILMGIMWAALHIIPDIQAHHTLTWIVWQRLYAIGLRILIVWIYNNTGKSLFAAIVFHATDNVSFALFPNYGSHYDPFYICILTALTVVIVIWLWGSETLARYRYARLYMADSKG
ncbi:MAG: CPBP family intramembrane metalloprotease [Caldilineaceae bacterium]|nr:CPBP family intramembrane metalloprotease [Caldilineaceae bacterium]